MPFTRDIPRATVPNRRRLADQPCRRVTALVSRTSQRIEMVLHNRDESVAHYYSCESASRNRVNQRGSLCLGVPAATVSPRTAAGFTDEAADLIKGCHAGLLGSD